MITKDLGGDRLGSGNKMKVDMKTYNRSNHDLSTIIKTTMAPGTLVPFLNIVGLPGDTIDIDLDSRIYTKPTVGPLFDSFKVQLDVFTIPVRLYVPKLHNNQLQIGRNMAQVKLPQMKLTANTPTEETEDWDNSQINPSCIFKYLGISGLGTSSGAAVEREFNALGFLSYWDIYKNYYANKQEEKGAVIHNVNEPPLENVTSVVVTLAGIGTYPLNKYPDAASAIETTDADVTLVINYTPLTPAPDPENIIIMTDNGEFTVAELFVEPGQITDDGTKLTCAPQPIAFSVWNNWRYVEPTDVVTEEPQVYTFPLENLDTMRNQILADVMSGSAFVIDENSIEPYNLPFQWIGTPGDEEVVYSKMTSLEGLALKTYQSDMFNNWVNTEWIDGVNGVNSITAVSTAGNEFTIDALTLAKDLWILLNRVNVSDGSYKSWIETVFTAGGYWRAETPMYEGGLSKEVVFDEVISNSEANGESDPLRQPLGTLAGRGVMGSKHKGGKVVIKPDEIVLIMGIISLTPRVTYSQGNTWDVNLKTMDDFHKPQLDGIGFQDLITDTMAWWDTEITTEPQFRSAGKQTAWLNYMTNVNRSYGNFAIENNEMFMTNNRRFEQDNKTIKDLTTYIDPKKYNYVFAETARDAQNFWVQIKCDIRARRVMSGKVIPNL